LRLGAGVDHARRIPVADLRLRRSGPAARPRAAAGVHPFRRRRADPPPRLLRPDAARPPRRGPRRHRRPARPDPALPGTRQLQRPNRRLPGPGLPACRQPPDLTARAFEDAGVDLVARADSLIYRAADTAAAERLVGALVEQHTDMSPTAAPEGPPPGTRRLHEPAGTPDAPAPRPTTHGSHTHSRY